MKNLFLLLILLAGVGQLVGQNYYVAIIHGKVTYNGTPLKLKSKITISGELRFSTKSDYIKISGPKGIYKLTPQEKVPGGSEFFTALSEEIFPRVTMRGSFAHSLGMDNSRPFFFMTEDVIWEGAKFPMGPELSSRSDDLVFAFKNKAGGITSMPAYTKKDKLVVRSASFPVKPASRVAIVLVENAAAWARSVDTASNIENLDVYSHSLLKAKDPATVIEGDRKAYMLQDYEPPAQSGILLGYLNAGGIVEKRPVLKDLRRQVKWMKPTSAGQLFGELGIRNHYEEIFGMLAIPSDLYDYTEKLIAKQR